MIGFKRGECKGRGNMTKLEVRSPVSVPFRGFALAGELEMAPRSLGVVIFAHGSGSSRHSPRNQFVARVLRQHGLSTLLFDLLTPEEEAEDQFTAHLRFNIELLAERLLGTTRWYHQRDRGSPIGYFGSSTGGGAALMAEAQSEIPIAAIVSRGGRPDLAGAALARVQAPTLLLVGSKDSAVIEMNRHACELMSCRRELRLIEGATHLFEEPGTLEQVAQMAGEWFSLFFQPARS